jgi:hypothetical protein
MRVSVGCVAAEPAGFSSAGGPEEPALVGSVDEAFYEALVYLSAPRVELGEVGGGVGEDVPGDLAELDGSAVDDHGGGGGELFEEGGRLGPGEGEGTGSSAGDESGEELGGHDVLRFRACSRW